MTGTSTQASTSGWKRKGFSPCNRGNIRGSPNPYLAVRLEFLGISIFRIRRVQGGVVQLSVFDEKGQNALAKIEISPNEEHYVQTKDSSLKIMKERFPGYQIELSRQRVTDSEGKMYYTFEVKKAGSAEVEIYLVKRDTGEIFLGEYDANNPERLLPGKPLD